MIKIKITMGDKGFPAQSQLPNMEPIWKDCEFFMNQEIKECDFWIVWGSMNAKESVICPPKNVIFIASEPPSVYKYEKKFLLQFNKIITSDKNTGHENAIFEQQSLPWWLGHDSASENKKVLSKTTYDELLKNNHLEKSKGISMIVSDKKSTEGHRKRLKFSQELKEHFKDKVDTFGMGTNQCQYKWDAISPYKYHIVIENSSIDDYWTEKLSDSILAEAYTFYYGCKNLDKYFDKDIYTEIDINDLNYSIKKIEGKIQEKSYEKNIDKIIQAKHLILNKYQLFPHIYEMCSVMPIDKKEIVTIKPESLMHKFIHKIKRKYGLTK